MKKLAFALVLVFSGIASAYTVPVCVQVCPTTAGPGDEVTLTAYDEDGVKVDLTEWDGGGIGIESNFWPCDPPWHPSACRGRRNSEVHDGRMLV